MIKAGEIVFLNSGVYPMTVESVNNNIAKCVWLNHEDELKAISFPVQMLTNKYPNAFRFWYCADTEYDDSTSMGNYSFSYERTHYQPFKTGLIVKVRSHPTMMTVQEVKEDNRILCIFFNKYGNLKKVLLPRILFETYKCNDYLHQHPDTPTTYTTTSYGSIEDEGW
jgi:uncharacterized protein YodC (DUF2158 family)